MREIRDIMVVPISTLYTWRERTRQDSSWPPDPARFTANPRAIEDALETKIMQYLRDNFISTGLDLSTYVLKQTLIMLVRSFVASGDLPESALNFKCSIPYMRRFLKSNGLSFRPARSCRRSNLDNQEESEFAFFFHVSLEIFGSTAMVNFDESSWRLVMVQK
jgi:transposase